MKHTFKTIFLTLIMFSLLTNVYGYDFKAVSNGDTIYYKKSDKANIIFVTCKDAGVASYVGDIVIPMKVEIEGKSYIVGGVGKEAFKNCSSLTSVKLPVGIEVIEDDAFRNCTILTEITIPEYVQEIGYCAFGNTALKKINIPAVKKIDGMTFKGCKNLKEVVMHDSIKTIGDYAFMDCVRLQKANLPKGLERLGRSAFMNCVMWEGEVTISYKIKNIGLYAFGNCHNLKTIRCEATAYIPYCEKYAFGDIRPINKTLIVPLGTTNAYKRFQEWQDFKEIVEE